MANESTTAAIIQALLGAPNALANGARSQWDQAKWVGNKIVGGQDYPQPAIYAGGPDYPAKNDANAYVRNNWPSEMPGDAATLGGTLGAASSPMQIDPLLQLRQRERYCELV